MQKRGIRLLGVAESFKKEASERSVLCGVVMRRDLVIDGFSFAYPTIGGKDSTEELIRLYSELQREDVNYICVSGSVISWYNVIDFHAFHDAVDVPTVCLTYEESPGLKDHFERNFPDDWTERVEVYESNGERQQVRLRTGFEVFLRAYDLETVEAREVLDGFMRHGRYPEPVRVARILAKEVYDSFVAQPPR